MPVTNIECQLVRAQISRYLRGEELPADVMRQLEAHLLACDECKEVLLARKSELRARLAKSPEKRNALKEAASKLKAAVSLPEEETRPMSTTASVSEPSHVAKNGLRPSVFAKPAAYTVVLAAVLVAMTQMSKGGGFFGPRALDSFNLPSNTAQVPVKSQQPVAVPNKSLPGLPAQISTVPKETPVLKTESLPTPVPVRPQLAPVVAMPSSSSVQTIEPTQSVAKLETHMANEHPVVEQKAAPNPSNFVEPKVVQPRRLVKKHRHKVSAIHVYDAQGNPVTP